MGGGDAVPGVDAQGLGIDLSLLGTEAGRLLALRRGPQVVDVAWRGHVHADRAAGAATVAVHAGVEIEPRLAVRDRGAAGQLQVAVEPVALAVTGGDAHL